MSSDKPPTTRFIPIVRSADQPDQEPAVPAAPTSPAAAPEAQAAAPAPVPGKPFAGRRVNPRSAQIRRQESKGRGLLIGVLAVLVALVAALAVVALGMSAGN